MGVPRVVWALSGVGLLGLMFALTLAARLAVGEEPIVVRRALSMAIYLSAGAVYLAASFLSVRRRSCRRDLLLMVAVAAGMRAAAWATPPARGGDFERYLWDGAVTAAGASPYRYSPQRVLEGNVSDPVIRSLAREGHDVLSRVNHPDLRAIYPPVAQGLFAGAHLLTPFDVAGWRVVLLVMDALAVLALVRLLRTAQLPWSYLTLYLWNPLLIFETYARLHVDLAVAPFVLGLVWALTTRRAAVAGLALAAAAGVKLWPMLLFPFLVAGFWTDRRRLVASMTACIGCVAVMAIPFAAALGGRDSGVLAYSLGWENATGAYRLMHGLGWVVQQGLHVPCHAGLIGRALTLATLLAIAVSRARRGATNVRTLFGSMATVVLFMLLLSPTVWPWYYVPLIPLAAVAPRGRLLVWTLLLPLIYLPRAYPGEYVLAVVIHLPVWVWLFIDGVREDRPPAAERA